MTWFSDVTRDLANAATLGAAQAAIRAEHGRSASAWLADHAGVSRRTARRWLSSAPPPSRAAAISNAARQANTVGVVAAMLRGATSMAVGVVAVAYDSRDEGSRTIGEIDVDDYVGGYLADAAAAIEAGDLAAAEDAMSNAIIGGYSTGLEDTLSVSDLEGITFRYS